VRRRDLLFDSAFFSVFLVARPLGASVLGLGRIIGFRHFRSTVFIFFFFFSSNGALSSKSANERGFLSH
jgi:hypothetical protein